MSITGEKQLPTIEEIRTRYVRATQFNQRIDESIAAHSLVEWITACGGPEVSVNRLYDWETTARAARDARDARAASAARAVWAAWDAWDARDAWAASAAWAVWDARATSAARAARAAWDASAARAAWHARPSWHASAARAAWDASHVAAICCWAVEIDDATLFARWSRILQVLEAGVWMIWVDDVSVSYVSVPEIHHESGRPHRDDGPAFRSMDLTEWFVFGVRVDEQIVMRPETQTIAQIDGEANEEVKRVRIERFGWERYLRESGSEVVDERFNERDQQAERLYRTRDGIRRVIVSDPSTGRRYALGVPREVSTCEQAQNFLSHGLDRRAIHRS